MKRLLLILPLLLLPLLALGQRTITYKGIKYKINTKRGTASVAQHSRYSIVPDIVNIASYVTYGKRKYKVTSIGEEAFSANICGGMVTPSRVTIPNTVTRIGDGAFWWCIGITSITIPTSVKSIGEHAFSACEGLTSIDIPSSVTSIGNWAFYMCTYLNSITIPASVKSLGEGAFGFCENLTDIYVKRTNPNYYNCRPKSDLTALDCDSCSLDDEYYRDYDTFYKVPEDCTLHVPAGCANAYRNTPPWDYFWNIVEY